MGKATDRVVQEFERLRSLGRAAGLAPCVRNISGIVCGSAQLRRYGVCIVPARGKATMVAIETAKRRVRVAPGKQDQSTKPA
jgi:hypothetical protein